VQLPATAIIGRELITLCERNNASKLRKRPPRAIQAFPPPSSLLRHVEAATRLPNETARTPAGMKSSLEAADRAGCSLLGAVTGVPEVRCQGGRAKGEHRMPAQLSLAHISGRYYDRGLAARRRGILWLFNTFMRTSSNPKGEREIGRNRLEPTFLCQGKYSG
jgi:hypothetical protein